MKAHVRVLAALLAIVAASWALTPAAQAGDIRPIQLPTPATMGLSGTWGEFKGTSCAGETVNPCVFRSYNTGLANNRWRTFITEAMRLPSITARQTAVAKLAHPYAFTVTGRSFSSSNGVTTIRSVGVYRPFRSLPVGTARQVISFSDTRVVETFIGFGSNAPQRGLPTLNQMAAQTQALALPSGGLIPLGHNS